jgi:hypothetical protein
MATSSVSANSLQGRTPESMLTLVEYLELSLDEGGSVVMVRRSTGVCTVYVGDPAGSHDDLTGHGTIAAALADEILELTQAGINQITIGNQPYRFVRSFTHIGDSGAVVFAPA